MRGLTASFTRIFAVVLLALGTDAAAVTFDDGLVHVIDAGNSFPLECVIVDDGPLGETTTLNALPGGEIGTLSCGSLTANGTSEINMLGGLVPVLRLFGNSTLFYSVSQSESLTAQDNSRVSVISGRIGAFTSGGTALVEISGGTFYGNGNVTNSSIVNIRGGEFGRVDGHSNSTLNVFGGSILEGVQTRNSARVNFHGGEIAGFIFAGDTAVFTIFGNGFNFPFGDIAATSGTLTGIPC